MYKKIRQIAKMSTEEAAFRLHIGGRTLQRYEAGEYVPPADVVRTMADIYDAPKLPTWYCKSVCPLGMKYGTIVEKDTAKKAA